MNENLIHFTIRGVAVGKGRARHRTVITRDGRQFNQEYTPAKTRNYEQLVRLEYERQVGNFMFPPDQTIRLDVRVYRGIPKSASAKKRHLMLSGIIRPGKKPDLSNIVKSIEDGLNAIAYHDDSQIAELHVESYYAETPRVDVTISILAPRG